MALSITSRGVLGLGIPKSGSMNFYKYAPPRSHSQATHRAAVMGRYSWLGSVSGFQELNVSGNQADYSDKGSLKAIGGRDGRRGRIGATTPAEPSPGAPPPPSGSFERAAW